MNKVELVEAVAKATGHSKKDSEKVVEVVVGAISTSLEKGKEVKLAGFGTFRIRNRKARVGVRPGTDIKIKIPASKVVSFKASKALKEKVN
jgi:DNA-binding protein HU-beta